MQEGEWVEGVFKEPVTEDAKKSKKKKKQLDYVDLTNKTTMFIVSNSSGKIDNKNQSYNIAPRYRSAKNSITTKSTTSQYRYKSCHVECKDRFSSIEI